MGMDVKGLESLAAQLEAIGNQHIKVDDGRIEANSAHWLGRLVNHLKGGLQNHITIAGLLHKIGANVEEAGGLSLYARSRLNNHLEAGRPISGREAAAVVRDIMGLKAKLDENKRDIDRILTEELIGNALTKLDGEGDSPLKTALTNHAASFKLNPDNADLRTRLHSYMRNCVEKFAKDHGRPPEAGELEKPFLDLAREAVEDTANANIAKALKTFLGSGALEGGLKRIIEERGLAITLGPKELAQVTAFFAKQFTKECEARPVPPDALAAAAGERAEKLFDAFNKAFDMVRDDTNLTSADKTALAQALILAPKELTHPNSLKAISALLPASETVMKTVLEPRSSADAIKKALDDFARKSNEMTTTVENRPVLDENGESVLDSDGKIKTRKVETPLPGLEGAEELVLVRDIALSLACGRLGLGNMRGEPQNRDIVDQAGRLQKARAGETEVKKQIGDLLGSIAPNADSTPPELARLNKELATHLNDGRKAESHLAELGVTDLDLLDQPGWLSGLKEEVDRNDQARDSLKRILGSFGNLSAVRYELTVNDNAETDGQTAARIGQSMVLNNVFQALIERVYPGDAPAGRALDAHLGLLPLKEARAHYDRYLQDESQGRHPDIDRRNIMMDLKRRNPTGYVKHGLMPVLPNETEALKRLTAVVGGDAATPPRPVAAPPAGPLTSEETEKVKNDFAARLSQAGLPFHYADRPELAFKILHFDKAFIIDFLREGLIVNGRTVAAPRDADNLDNVEQSLDQLARCFPGGFMEAGRVTTICSQKTIGAVYDILFTTPETAKPLVDSGAWSGRNDRITNDHAYEITTAPDGRYEVKASQNLQFSGASDVKKNPLSIHFGVGFSVTMPENGDVPPQVECTSLDYLMLEKL